MKNYRLVRVLFGNAQKVSVKNFVKGINANQYTFNNVIQRSLAWTQEQKSLLIDTVLRGQPVPPLFARRSYVWADSKEIATIDEIAENKASGNKRKVIAIGDMLDGKQRGLGAFYGFLSNQFALKGLQPFECYVSEVDEEAQEDAFETEVEEQIEMVDLNGMYFKDLPEYFQDLIKDYTLSIAYYEDMTDEEADEMFNRLNNGTPLKAIELLRAKASDLPSILELKQHPLFVGETTIDEDGNEKYVKGCFTEKQRNGYKDEDAVIKAHIIIYENEKAINAKDVQPIISNHTFTQEEKDELTAVFTRIKNVHDNILANVDNTEAGKLAKKIATRIYTRTHLISLTGVTAQSLRDGMDEEDFQTFVMSFFNGSSKPTQYASYNDYINAGANSKKAVEKRIGTLNAKYLEFKEMMAK